MDGLQNIKKLPEPVVTVGPVRLPVWCTPNEFDHQVAPIQQSVTFRHTAQPVQAAVGPELTKQGFLASLEYKPTAHGCFDDQVQPFALEVQHRALVTDSKDVFPMLQAVLNPLPEFRLVDQVFH